MEYNQFLFNELFLQAFHHTSDMSWDGKFNMLKDLYGHWCLTDDLLGHADKVGTVESIEKYLDYLQDSIATIKERYHV